ncbi:unnamed protein product [Sphagnum troendelagicum]|uniref:phenylalanine--tRNA ligase n=1 Tax=Sphagnum troendelagicum TaxID=128251 RepID=A0ABP0U8E7_9BRYO
MNPLRSSVLSALLPPGVVVVGTRVGLPVLAMATLRLSSSSSFFAYQQQKVGLTAPQRPPSSFASTSPPPPLVVCSIPDRHHLPLSHSSAEASSGRISLGFCTRQSVGFCTRQQSWNRNLAVVAAAASVTEVGGGGSSSTISREEVVREDDPTNNVPDTVFGKIGLQLHNRKSHPLGILKNAIYSYFDETFPGVFHKVDNLLPIVSVKANFDDVLTPPDHVSRSYNDTYYVTADTVLRCHTSAHQAELLRQGLTHFLVTGDVYRRDAIDATHYPVFHQMEGLRVFTQQEWEAAGMDGTALAAQELKKTLEGLARHLFGDVQMRWVDTYFPFTDPSYELEIFFQGKWMEVLGCGVTEQQILCNNGCAGTTAWAFGLGLERLAMVLFDIPDIRLFWSNDSRFTSQFKSGQLGTKFKSFSKYPPCYKDISFWISDEFSENNLCEIVRGIAGDLVEEVVLIDEFTNPKKGKTSHCYRIAYRSMERSLTDDEINALQAEVRQQVESKLKITLR